MAPSARAQALAWTGAGTSATLLRQARAVLRHSPEAALSEV